MGAHCEYAHGTLHSRPAASTSSHRFAGLYLGDAAVTELFGTDTVKRAVAKNTRERAKVNVRHEGTAFASAPSVAVACARFETGPLCGGIGARP
jgi:hypothetical protein